MSSTETKNQNFQFSHGTQILLQRQYSLCQLHTTVTERYYHKCQHVFIQVPISCPILIKLLVCGQIQYKSKTISSKKVRPVDVALFHANKKTDGEKSTNTTELIVTSSGTAFLKRRKVLEINKFQLLYYPTNAHNVKKQSY